MYIEIITLGFKNLGCQFTATSKIKLLLYTTSKINFSGMMFKSILIYSWTMRL